MKYSGVITLSEEWISKEDINKRRDKVMAGIARINDFIAHSNCSDFMIKQYDGSDLYLIGSFDLCYYSEMEILFEEVSYISMDTWFSLWDLTKDPFKVKFETDNQDSLFEIQIRDDMEEKNHIIRCDEMQVHIGVQGLDETAFEKRA